MAKLCPTCPKLADHGGPCMVEVRPNVWQFDPHEAIPATNPKEQS